MDSSILTTIHEPTVNDEQLSHAAIDRLGDRLREGHHTEADLRLLDEYRDSFSNAYEFVLEELRGHVGFASAGGRLKTTGAIVEKLRRIKTRLSQMQDVAGCRIVVSETVEQERVEHAIKAAFPSAEFEDRRVRPSHGYRAVHAFVVYKGKIVEIQIRTELQQRWATLCELFADLIDPGIKYGNGDADILSSLQRSSEAIKLQEDSILEWHEVRRNSPLRVGDTSDRKSFFDEWTQFLEKSNAEIMTEISRMIAQLEEIKER